MVQKEFYLIISTGRAGSTTVYNYLNQRKDLKLPKNKEPHHFVNIKKYKGLYELINKIYISNKEEYLSLYCDSHVIMDASVGYFFYIEEVVKKIKDYKLNPKVIFLYREPVSRLNSLFSEIRKKKIINCEMKNFLDTEYDSNFWWEYHKDNVFYFDVFNCLKDNFDDMISIDYKLLDTKPRMFFKIIDDFVKIENRSKVSFVYENSRLENYLFKLIKINFRGKSYLIKFILKNNFLRKISSFFLIEKSKPVGNLYIKRSLMQYNELNKKFKNKLFFVNKK